MAHRGMFGAGVLGNSLVGMAMEPESRTGAQVARKEMGPGSEAPAQVAHMAMAPENKAHV